MLCASTALSVSQSKQIFGDVFINELLMGYSVTTNKSVNSTQELSITYLELVRFLHTSHCGCVVNDLVGH